MDLSEFLDAGGEVEDNCGIDSTSFVFIEDVSDNNTCPETISRVYQIADLCGNTSTCMQIITINDEILPTLTCPDSLTASCSTDEHPPYLDFFEFIAAGGSANDNCAIDTASFSFVRDTSTSNTCPAIIQRTYQIADLCGNTTTCTQIITINDEVLPIMTCPDTIFTVCENDTSATYLDLDAFIAAGAFVEDNCGIDTSSFALIDVEENGSTCPKIITRTYEIADICGNTSTCSQILVVDDEIVPTITCPSDLTLECSIDEAPAYNNLEEFINAGGTVNDNCLIDDNSLTLLNEISDNNTCPETITRIYQIADACGNTDSCSQTILVRPNNLTCNILDQQDESCFGSQDGSFTVEANGCSGSYTFDIGLSQNQTGVFTNLTAGTYSVTVTDDQGCTSICDDIIISSPTEIICEIESAIDETCSNADDASITVSATGGTGTHTFDIGFETNNTGVFTHLEAGSYSITVSDENGCQSVCEEVILTQPLPFSCSLVSISDETCEFGTDGQIVVEGIGGVPPYTFTLNNMSSLTGTFTGLDAGTYSVEITDANNCFAICNDIIVVNDYSFTTDSSLVATICEGDSIIIANSVYYNSGQYQDTLENILGCDSIVYLDLSVIEHQTTNLDIAICENEEYTVGNSTYTLEGTYVDSLLSIHGCDSVVNLNLTVHPIYFETISAEICDDESLTIGLNEYDITGNYFDTLQTIHGCDSVINLQLIVHENHFNEWDVTICEGDAYTIGDSEYTLPGIYSNNVPTVHGCDSIIKINLEVLPIMYEEIEANICEGDSILIGDVYYSSNGDYVDTITSSVGCDSVINLHVEVHDSVIELFEELIICEGDSVLIDGEYQTEAGIYTENLISIHGCDSISHTELIIENIASLISQDGLICLGDSIELSVAGSDNVIWSPSEGLSCTDCLNPMVSPTETTTYTAIIESCAGDIIEESITITVNNPPIVTSRQDVIEAVKGETILLEAELNDLSSTFYWVDAFGDTLAIGPPQLEVIADTDTEFEVIAIDAFGCQDQIIISLRVSDECDEGEVLVPNFITPNFDGSNDKLRIEARHITRLGTLQIFNRWGELVFETDDPTNVFWDGTFRGSALNHDVYVYMLEVYCLNNEMKLQTGNITIIE